MRSGATVFLSKITVGGKGEGIKVADSKSNAYTVINAPRGLNVRDGASPTANKVGAPLANGSIIVVSEKSGDWFKHASGWSLSTDGSTPFLQPYDPSASASSSSAVGTVGGSGGTGAHPLAWTGLFSGGSVFGSSTDAPPSYNSSVNGNYQSVASAVATAQAEGGEVWVVCNCANGLNVRSAPDTNAPLAGSLLTHGSAIIVSEKQGTWVKHKQGWSVNGDGTRSFLTFNSAFTKPAAGSATLTATPSTSSGASSASSASSVSSLGASFAAMQVAAPQPQGQSYVVVNCPTGLNVRAFPNTNAQKVAMIYNGQHVIVYKVEGNWANIGNGWSMMSDGFKPFLTADSSGGMGMSGGMGGMAVSAAASGGGGAAAYRVRNCPTGLNVRAAPSPTAALIGSTLKNDTIVYVTNTSGLWMQHAGGWSLSQDATGKVLLAPGGSGAASGAGFVDRSSTFTTASSATQASASYKTPTITASTQQEMYVVQNAPKGLNIRSGPGSENSLVGAPLANGSHVVVIAHQGQWAQHLSGWSMETDGKTTFLARLAASSASEDVEGIPTCQSCGASFRAAEDVFCAKCGRPKAAADAGAKQPAFNPDGASVDADSKPPPFNPDS